MVEVFKTNITDPAKAVELKISLLHRFKDSKINFDLEDCDKILRVESEEMESEKVIEILSAQGVWCEVLQDS
jgi:hypothetical protein